MSQQTYQDELRTNSAAEADLPPVDIPQERPPRVVIERVTPQVDVGRFPAKRVVGDLVTVEASIYAEGREEIAAMLRYHHAQGEWRRSWMTPLGNDRWQATFRVDELGLYEFQIAAWIDHFGSWLWGVEKKVEAGKDVAVEWRVGGELVAQAASRAPAADRAALEAAATSLGGGEARGALAAARRIKPLVESYQPREPIASSGRFPIEVARVRARCGAWYEFFPRSCGSSGMHGRFEDAARRLPYIAAMGFDVVYLPPIHPIGHSDRKGPNNTLGAGPTDPGSPWAIGSEAGGHTAVHPDLGTIDDFRAFLRAAEELGLEVALDIAFQCSPDHPWLTSHPEWFRHLPDGSIRHAENPPKRYEDIVPLDFESEAWQSLWVALRDVVLFWAKEGVRIFRVDNPHTKPFAFWEWMIRSVRQVHPDAIFLSEAFTRPSVMEELAKRGFDQSYTYFTWRNTRDDIEGYFSSLVQPPLRDYFRPNLWPNTPDILPGALQSGGRAGAAVRVGLAATLGANYGIYGPAFELADRKPLEPGGEEYLDSEKYQLRDWDIERSDSLRDFIATLNRIRQEHPALQQDWTLAFHRTDNDRVVCFSKRSEADGDLLVMVVNLDPHFTQAAMITLDDGRLGRALPRTFQVEDLLGGRQFLWTGTSNRVEMNPQEGPMQILALRTRVRSENDFEYFL